MKIKSLFLGSAAAVVGVTGAQAADIIIPEPEMVEYVRVCDTAGEGFFYIPGTETCLKIGGYVRYQIDFGRDYGPFIGGLSYVDTAGSTADYSDYGWIANTRGQLEVTAQSETELGTLTGFIAFQGNSTGGANVGIDSAHIELGGLGMGYSDNAFDGGINGEHDALGGAKVNRVYYTFAAGNFDATISIDDDGDPIVGAAAFGTVTTATALGTSGADFVPNVSGNVGGDFGIVDARLYGAYDNDTSNFAVKGVLGVDVGANGKLQVAGYYTDGPTYVFGAQTIHAVNGFTGFASSLGAWSEYSVAAAYQHQVTSAFAVTVGGQYWWNFQHADFNFNTGTATLADIDAWRIGLMLDYEIVENFDAKLALNYTNVDNNSPFAGGWDGTAGGDLNAFSGFLRFQRSF